MTHIVFWTCLGLLLYTYAGYPLLLAVTRLVVRRRTKPATLLASRVSLVISAYNEQESLEGKILNSLALEYPRELLEIIVASDGSTDQTNSIAESFADQGIILMAIPQRLGKTNVQNQAVLTCSGDILVFTDANSLLEKDALQKLVQHFGDPVVGVVEGRRLDRSRDDSGTAKMELTYRDYETMLKVLESDVGLCFGATGPIYAVRRECYVPLPSHMISDLMEPMMIYSKTRMRQVFEPLAISREDVLSDINREYQRKIRIITRCLHSLFHDRSLLNPFKNPLLVFQVTSHRLLRWFAPILLMIMFVANLALLRAPLYQFTGLMFVVFVGLIYMGSRGTEFYNRHQILKAPYYYYKVNLASLMAIWNWIRSVNIQTWTPDR